MQRFPAGSLGALFALALLSGCASAPLPPCKGGDGGVVKSGSSLACRWVPGAIPKPDSYVALLEDPDGTIGQVVVAGSKGEQVIDKARDGAPLDGSQAPAPVPEEKLQRDFGAALAARPMLPERFVLHFEGGLKLIADSAALLPQIVENAAKRPGADISIVGHTDTSGEADANEALALRRAQSVAEQLKAQGLKVVAMSVESYGEKDLLIETPDDTAEPRNRRVEISVR